MITADRKGQLQLSDELSATAQTAMILPHLKSASLISIGQLCDDNCDVLLNKTKLIAIKNNKIILQGIRNPFDNLWDIPVKKQHISPQNYQTPAIHPAIYPQRITKKSSPKMNHTTKVHPNKSIFREELRNFQELTDHNILDCILHNQTVNPNATEYCKESLNVKTHPYQSS